MCLGASLATQVSWLGAMLIGVPSHAVLCFHPAKHNKLPESTLWSYARDIIKGINYLHSQVSKLLLWLLLLLVASLTHTHVVDTASGSS